MDDQGEDERRTFIDRPAKLMRCRSCQAPVVNGERVCNRCRADLRERETAEDRTLLV